MIELSLPKGLWGAYGILSLGLLLGVCLSLSLLEKRRGGRLARFAQHDVLARLTVGYRQGLRKPLNGFVVLAAAGFLFALAGPRWGEGEFGNPRGSREVLVLLDTSESMKASNPPPDRMSRAREKISALLDSFPGDHFGLIAFSGAAVVQCPLTTDHAYFRTVLQSVTTDTLTAEGTNIESAFQEAENLFRDNANRGRGSTARDRIILLISDGEAVRGDAIAAASQLGRLGRVVVMGIGDPDGAEVAIPRWMAQSRFGASDTGPHWSVLDEEHLATIALEGGGVYVRSTLGNDDVRVIARELSYLEGFRGERDPALRKPNQYRWPLCVALLCIAMEGIWLVTMPYVARRHAAEGARDAQA